MNTDTKSINSKVERRELVNWKELKIIQQDSFKEISAIDKQRLKDSLITNEFIQPFYVWDAPDGHIYCLDGKHRTDILMELVDEGYNVPDMLPAVYIQCDDRKQAARYVLLFSSSYARVTEYGLLDFITLNDIAPEELTFDISIPNIDLGKLHGDMNKDFGSINTDMDLANFKDEVVLKLTYTREEYSQLNERLHSIVSTGKYKTSEEVISDLIKGYELSV